MEYHQHHASPETNGVSNGNFEYMSSFSDMCIDSKKKAELCREDKRGLQTEDKRGLQKEEKRGLQKEEKRSLQKEEKRSLQKDAEEASKLSSMERAYATILMELGEDIHREGLVRTPLRAATAMQNFTIGYHASVRGEKARL